MGKLCLRALSATSNGVWPRCRLSRSLVEVVRELIDDARLVEKCVRISLSNFIGNIWKWRAPRLFLGSCRGNVQPTSFFLISFFFFFFCFFFFSFLSFFSSCLLISAFETLRTPHTQHVILFGSVQHLAVLEKSRKKSKPRGKRKKTSSVPTTTLQHHTFLENLYTGGT